MKNILKTILFVAAAGILVNAGAFYFASDFYHAAVAEDGLLENVTAIGLLLISVLFLIRIFVERKNRNGYWLALNILIVLGSFFGFGEEISWGQRIFSVESGDFFVQNNLQGETNLHNMEVGGVNINKLIFSQGLVIIFGFYFVVAQLLYRKYSPFKRLVDLFGVQLPKIVHTAVILIGTGVVLSIPDLRIWELWEAYFVTTLLMVFVDPWNKEEGLLVRKK